MEAGLPQRRRLGSVGGGAVAVGGGVRAVVARGVWVPERGVLLGVRGVELSLPLPLPRPVFVLCQQRVKALPAPRHRPPLAQGMCLVGTLRRRKVRIDRAANYSEV